MAITVTSLGARNNGQFPVNVTTRLTGDNSYVRGGYALASFIGTPGALVIHGAVKNGKGLRLNWNQASNKLVVFERMRDTTRELIVGDKVSCDAATSDLDIYWIAPFSVSVLSAGLLYVGSTSVTITTASRGRITMSKWASAGSTSLAKASLIITVSKKPGTQTAATFTGFTLKKNDMLAFRRTRRGQGGAKSGRVKIWLEYRAQPAACEVVANATLASVQIDTTVFRQNRT